MKKLFAIVIILLAFSASSFAQATASANAHATIVTPIGIAWVDDMNFGNVAVTDVAGTVILAPDDSRTITGGVTLPVVTGTVTAATFTVTGTPAYTYAITLPTDDHVIENTTAGVQTMIVNVFTSDPTPTGALDGSGTQQLNVGATLNVGALQEAGVYTSVTPFDVTVNYN